MLLSLSLLLGCATKSTSSTPTSTSAPLDRPLGAGAPKTGECTQDSECHLKHSNNESLCMEEFCYIQSPPELNVEDYTEIPFSKVKITNTAYPRKSIEMENLQLKQSLCNIRFFVDESGNTTDLDLSECPLFFHSAAKEVGPHWRFQPTLNEAGEAIKITTVLKIVVQ